MICTKTSIDDYENLFRVDVLDATDIVRDDIDVHQDFKNQLKKSKDGWCKTWLMWKDNSISMQNNKLGSFGKLKNLLRNL